MIKDSKFKLSEEARNARNAYLREWRKNNKDKASAYNNSYWERRAKKASNAEEKQNGTERNG